MADRILVNSEFTASVFKQTISSKIKPEIVYPCTNIRTLDEQLKQGEPLPIPRYDPNKKIELALEAFVMLYNKQPTAQKSKLQLVIAGGYDPNVQHNVDYLKKLQRIVENNKLTYHLFPSNTERYEPWPDTSVIFITDVSEHNKLQLMRSSLALLYTPSKEHFGIVPVESMVCQCPVIAVASGGLLETVTHDRKVGLLCEAEGKEFAAAMEELVKDEKKAEDMGRNGRKRAMERFSFETFADTLNKIVMGRKKVE